MPITGTPRPFSVCSEFQCSIKLNMKSESYAAVFGEQHVPKNHRKKF